MFGLAVKTESMDLEITQKKLSFLLCGCWWEFKYGKHRRGARAFWRVHILLISKLFLLLFLLLLLLLWGMISSVRTVLGVVHLKKTQRFFSDLNCNREDHGHWKKKRFHLCSTFLLSQDYEFQSQLWKNENKVRILEKKKIWHPNSLVALKLFCSAASQKEKPVSSFFYAFLRLLFKNVPAFILFHFTLHPHQASPIQSDLKSKILVWKPWLSWL